MTRTESLAAEIVSAVQAAFDSGECQRGSLRRLAVGPDFHYQVLQVYALPEWSNYSDPRDSSGLVAELALGWFNDAIDALPETQVPPPASTRALKTPPISHPDPRVRDGIGALVAQLREEIRGALRLIVEKQLLGEFDQLVGLMEFGYTKSDYADLVAFYHPDGLHPLMPMLEKIGMTLVYPWGALHPRGVTLFYPEGDEEALRPQAKAGVRSYLFEEMESARFPPRGREVFFKMKGDLDEVSLSPGHTQEDFGWHSSQEVEEALLAHFTSRPELSFDPAKPPDPADPKATAAWREKFAQAKADPSEPIRALLAAGGVEAARAFIEWVPADDDARAEAWLDLGDECFGGGRYQEALDAFARTPKAWSLSRWRRCRPELRSLLALGRIEEALALGSEVAEKGGKDEKEIGRIAWGMALAFSGKSEEALEVLEGLKERDCEVGFACAVALQQTDEASADRALRGAIRDSRLPLKLGLGRYLTSERLLRTLERLDSDARAAQQGAETLGRLRVTFPAPKLEVDVDRMLARPRFEYRLARKNTRERNPERKNRRMQTWAREGSRIGAVAEQDGFFQFEVATLERTHVPSEGSLEDVAVCGGIAYAADNARGLQLIDLSGPSPRSLGVLDVISESGMENVALGDGFLALGRSDGAALFDLADPRAPRQVGHVGTPPDPKGGPGLLRGLAASGHYLFVSSDQGGVGVYRVDDPARPAPVTAFKLEKVSAGSLAVLGDILAVQDGSVVALIDVVTPEKPRVMGLLSHDFQCRTLARRGDEIAVLGQNGIFTVDVSDREKVKITGAGALLGEDDEPSSISAKAAFFEGDELYVLDEDADVEVLERKELPAQVEEAAAKAGELAARLGALAPALQQWIERSIAEWSSKGEPLGALEVRRGSTSIGLRLAGAAGLLELPKKLYVRGVDVAMAELAGRSWPEEDETAELKRAWAEIIQKVLRALPSTEAFRKAAAGRVYLLDGTELIEVRDASKPWRPDRPETKLRERSLDERLGDYKLWDRMVDQATANAELRAQILEKAAQGHGGAMRVASRLAAVDAAAVGAALECAVRGGSQQAIDELAEMKRPQDVELFEALLRDGNESQRVAAAQALGRYDHPLFVEKVRRDLADDEPHRCVEELRRMRAALPELLPALRAWMAKATPQTSYLGEVALALFRAGEAQMPAVVEAAARLEKRDEEYHSSEIGIPALDRQDWNEAPICQAQRVWTCPHIAEHILALRARGDGATSLWPKGLAPEPHAASWGYLLAALMPHLEAAGAAAWLEEALLARAQAAEGFDADKALLQALLERKSKANLLEDAIRLADPMALAPGFSEKLRGRFAAHAVACRVVRGFQLVQERRLAEARQHADAARSRAPSDGQVCFLDARLCWLEKKDPLAAVQRVQEAIDRVSKGEWGARGRLLNLAGVALVELGKPEEAIPWFERASKEHQDDPIYLANIAEAYEKMGQKEEAERFADQCRRRGGGKLAAVKRILKLTDA